MGETEAIQKLSSGEAKALEGKLAFVETSFDFGLPVDEHRQLAADLRTLKVGMT